MRDKILITGNNGYIGPVMAKLFQENGYKVIGLDSNYYQGCDFFPVEKYIPSGQIIKDIRDVNEKDLEGISAVIHLAALSNDPLGELNPFLTSEINDKATINLARIAKKQGIKRFIFASSCSLYGIADDDIPISEEGKLNPITAYAKAKVEAEQGLSKLADDTFHPVYMRNATVYGLSPKLRLDLVVNNLTAYAYLTGRVTILSDGTPWRPLIHVEDFCRAYLAVLHAPIEKIHNQAFNVGQNRENYQVQEVARIVEEIIPNCRVEILNETGPDERSYRVDFTKIMTELSEFNPLWNIKKGVKELYHAFKKNGITLGDFESDQYFRVRKLKNLLETEALDNHLRFINN